MRSTKRLPRSLQVPNEPLRQRTAGRDRLSARSFVRGTPRWRVKVHRQGNNFTRSLASAAAFLSALDSPRTKASILENGGARARLPIKMGRQTVRRGSVARHLRRATRAAPL